MNFYYILAKLFSFELKKKYKELTLDIRNMSPKKVIKMINIQKSYSVLIDSILSIISSLVPFGPFCPLWFYSVYFGPIWSILSTLILFVPIWSTLVLFISFCPFQFYSSILSTLILFGHISPHWSYLVHSIHFSSI